VNRMARLVDHSNLRSSTQVVISREKARRQAVEAPPESNVARRWKHVAELARRWSRSRTHYQEKLNVSTTEHMSSVDAFDGGSVRKGEDIMIKEGLQDDLLTVSPEIDDRLSDEGRD
jgi:5'-nucleotidase